MKKRNLVVVRGGGDIATGTIYKLVKCGFAVLVLEIENPSAIRAMWRSVRLFTREKCRLRI